MVSGLDKGTLNWCLFSSILAKLDLFFLQFCGKQIYCILSELKVDSFKDLIFLSRSSYYRTIPFFLTCSSFDLIKQHNLLSFWGLILPQCFLEDNQKTPWGPKKAVVNLQRSLLERSLRSRTDWNSWLRNKCSKR